MNLVEDGDVSNKIKGKIYFDIEFEKANECYDNGQYKDALNNIEKCFKHKVDVLALYTLALKCAKKLKEEELENFFSDLIKNFNSLNSFYKIGKFYFDGGKFDLSINFFLKELERKPRHKASANDLAVAYASIFKLQEAIDVIIKYKLKGFWHVYYLAKLNLLLNNTIVVHYLMAKLQRMLTQSKNSEYTEIIEFKINELKETLARLNLVSKIENPLRDWHFIQYGSILINLDGVSEKNELISKRFLHTVYTNSTFNQIAQYLKELFKKLNVNIEQIVFLPDYDSEVIARYLALEFNLSVKSYRNSSVQNCMIVCAKSDSLKNYTKLNQIENNQILFALSHNWNSENNICPDIIGSMTVDHHLPWQNNRKTPEFMETGKTSDDFDSKISAIKMAIDVFDRTITNNVASDDIAFYVQKKALIKCLMPDKNNFRFYYSIESPVMNSF